MSHDEWLDEWERETLATARRSRWRLRFVLTLLTGAWLLNASAILWGGASLWNWGAVCWLPPLGVLNLRSTARLDAALDRSLLSIEAARVRGERA